MRLSIKSKPGLLPIALSLLMLTGCGSDSGSDSTATSITGTVTASAVDGCSLTVLDDHGSTVAGPVLSSAGTFSVDIPDSELAGDLVMTCSGGTYTDEASGETTNADVLSARIDMATLTPGSTVNLTPGTTIIQGLVAGGMSREEAEGAFADAFGFTPDHTVRPNMSGSGSDDENLAGLHAGAFSHLNAELGHNPADQFDLLTAITEDLAADGSLDGNGATTMTLPMDTTNHFSSGMIAHGNAMGLAADELGVLPFTTVAETASYRIEYQAGMMGARQGKTVFSLMVTDLTTGSPVTGAELSLIPTMTMATMSHGTPVDSIIEQEDGVYQCTVYYLMASTMNGVSAGYWSLKTMINGESATFYPEVMMAMGDTARATLKDGDDLIAGMMGNPAEVRSYYLFKESLSGESGNHSFSLFIATRESMMNHPALTLGRSLTDENGQEWTIDSLAVEVSTDSGSNYTTMTDQGNGHWSVDGLSGLTDGESSTILVRLTVNGIAKTNNGLADGDPASFTVTP